MDRRLESAKKEGQESVLINMIQGAFLNRPSLDVSLSTIPDNALSVDVGLRSQLMTSVIRLSLRNLTSII